MKFVAVFLIVAYLFAESNSQLLPPAPLLPVVPPVLPVPFVPPFLGFPRFFPGFPFFGGLGGFGPFGFGPFGLRRFGLFGPFGRFGRSVAEEKPSRNETTCHFVSNSSVIRCEGERAFECPVETRLTELRDITIRLPNLSMVAQPIKAGQNETEAVRLFSRVWGAQSTLINPRTNKDVIISIYSSPVLNEPGFFVKDEKCMDQIENLVSTLSGENLRFSLKW